MRRINVPQSPEDWTHPVQRLALVGAAPRVRSVCLYTCSFNPSGMGVHMLALTRHLVESGLRVLVMYWPAAASEPLMARAEQLGASTVHTPHPRDPRYPAAVVQALQDAAPDVFHVHVGTGKENFGGGRAARTAGVPAVVETLHLPWLLRAKPKRRSFFDSLDGVDRIIAVSDGLRRTYERIGLPADRIVTVPNGVVPRLTAPGREAARRSLGLDDAHPVLMSVGRLAVQKGHVDLVRALPALLERFPGLVAVIAGAGHLHDQLLSEAERLGVGSALRLLGYRPDAAQLLDAADVFVLPSREEGMPMAALEAMDAGLPVVATRVIGTDEVVRDGETGLLVPPRDPSALAAALTRVLADDELRREMAEEGRRLFAHRFTAARMTADTIAVYDDVLAGIAPERQAAVAGLRP